MRMTVRATAKTILAPTDLSPASVAGVIEAATVARTLGAKRRQSLLGRLFHNGTTDAIIRGSVRPVLTVLTNGAAAA